MAWTTPSTRRARWKRRAASRASRRPRRTLKNLFQEAGVPPWERDRVPLLAIGADVVWVAGLGVDVRYAAAKNAPGVLPEWRKIPG